MPLYEYHCSKCDKNFEVLQRFSDAPVTVHEDCGGTVERVLSAPAFQFKGSGWYVTDYGKGGNKPGTLSDHAAHDKNAHEKKPSDSGKKSGDSEKKSADSKSGESPSSESKAVETKSETKTESKNESKPAESKPAAKAD